MHLCFISDWSRNWFYIDKTNLYFDWKTIKWSNICILDEKKLAEYNKEIEILKNQTEKDVDEKEKLKRQVLEKNKECKTLNNRLQEAKVNI